MSTSSPLAGTHDGDLLGQAATHRKFQVENCTLLQVTGGKVSRVYHSDTLGLMGQLGLAGGA